MTHIVITKGTVELKEGQKSAAKLTKELQGIEAKRNTAQVELGQAIADGNQADIATAMQKAQAGSDQVQAIQSQIAKPLIVETTRDALMEVGERLFQLAEASPAAFAELYHWTIDQEVDGKEVKLVVRVRNNQMNSRAHFEADVKQGTAPKPKAGDQSGEPSK